LNFAAAFFLPPADPKHHPGRRNPDFETAEIRHKPPPATSWLSHLHTRCAETHLHAADEHGYRAIPVATSAQPDLARALSGAFARNVPNRGGACADLDRRRFLARKKPQDREIQKGKGCGVCNNTATRGAAGLYEVMGMWMTRSGNWFWLRIGGGIGKEGDRGAAWITLRPAD